MIQNLGKCLFAIRFNDTVDQSSDDPDDFNDDKDGSKQAHK